jgi:hypothetical protein
MTKSIEELKLERAKVQQQMHEIMEIAACYDKKEWNPSFRSLLEMTKVQLAYLDAALAARMDA